MSKLTKLVINRLSGPERAYLDALLATNHLSYDDDSAKPNIEELADLVIAHSINSGDAAASALEERVRELIVEELLAVESPVLQHHVAFFSALKARSFGLPSVVWIFTTNYDVLFETAATLAGVELHTGFIGATSRFFEPGEFSVARGRLHSGRFNQNPRLIVNLIKLHGSLSWHLAEGQLIEQHPQSIDRSTTRVVVLPRRRKVIDTLAPPYDQLFACASRILGTSCRYLVSCGFSFSDEHINQNLLLPALRANRIRLTALNQEECAGMKSMLALPSFSARFSTHAIVSGKRLEEGTDLWKFESLVKAL